MQTLLIANRGEIARRVIRTARRLGIRTVAVYSDADATAPHVRDADDAVRLGPAPVADSYLNTAAVLAAARVSGADAIHPGYGFLSENAAFARAVEAAGLIFVGPPAAAIEAMGDKARAKRAMIAAGVPCVPGYQGEDQSDARLLAEAETIGLPLMVKAAAGGGGRGMRLVTDMAALPEALRLARSEAESAFGSGDLILERAILRPRHVEAQVFADAHGNCIHLGERDCSVQRRHQKVLEEAPSPAMTATLRAEMGAAAVAAARAVDYRGAGTVEFLLDEAGAFHFLEMNTRLQVEHPVTEMVTGLDLVEWQLRIAEGDPLPMTQDQINLTGHAIEARLYAEDPATGFLPSAGPVRLWRPGPGARVDDGIETGGEVSAYYDPMVAKIVAHGPTRAAATRALRRALSETAFFGPASNRDFLIDALGREDFANGPTTAFIAETYGDAFAPAAPGPAELAFAAALLHELERRALWPAGVAEELAGWSSAGRQVSHYDLEGAEAVAADIITEAGAVAARIGEDTLTVEALTIDGAQARARIGGAALSAVFHRAGDVLDLAFQTCTITLRRLRPGAGEDDAAASGRVTAPMHGLLLDLRVQSGDKVAKGQTVAVLEAMKMQHEIRAPAAGTVTETGAESGQQLAAGALILIVETEA